MRTETVTCEAETMVRTGESREGVVVAVCGTRVSVAVENTDACHSCEASHTCQAAGLRTRRLDVDDAEHAPSLRPGDRVKVRMARGTARQAVWLAFGVPLLLVAAGVSLNLFGVSEQMSFVCAIILLALYYCLLRMLRKKVDRKMRLQVVKLEGCGT